MIRHALILLLIYGGIVLQASVVADWPGISRPFLPALLLVVIAASCGPATAILWSGCVGLMLDAISTERLGTQLGLAAILALGLQLLRSTWRSCHPLSLTVATMGIAAFWRALSPMTLAVLTGRVVDPHVVLKSAICEATSTAVVTFTCILITFGLTGNLLRSGSSDGHGPRVGMAIR